MSLMAGWENFYVILGSAAAGLTGLTFVVIALIADAHSASETGLRAFVTPTIVHFCSVLALSAFLSAPGHTVMSIGLGLAAAGVAGLVYSGVIAKNMRRMTVGYTPVREDWLWHVIWPAAAYGALLAAAFLHWHRPQLALYGVAVLTTLLLFIGIHNAWDVAVSISTSNRQKKEQGRP